MIWIIAVIALFVVVLILVVRENLALKSIINSLSIAMDEHVAEVENMYHQMRGIRHDYRHQLNLLKAYRQDDMLSELDSHLELMNHELNQVDTIIRTGNVSVDAIVNSKLSLAKSKGIKLNVKGLVPAKLVLSNLEIGILLGNLLSNAMDAAILTNEPFIRLYLAVIKGNLYISCTNSTQGKISFFKSFKGEGHGYGMNRIHQVLQQHNGWMHQVSEDGVVVSEINIPLRVEK